MKNKKIILISVSLISIVLISLLGVYIYKWEYRKPLLEVHFFSLNKGRSIFIRTPENETILVGGGQNSEVIRGLTNVMSFYNRKINRIIVPSAIPTQIGGLIEVIERYEIDEIIMPKIMATSTVFSELIKLIRKKKIHIEEVERGDEIKLGMDSKLNILFPYKEFKFNKTSLPELGFLLNYKNTNAYLFGNLSKTIQKDILKNLKVNNSKNIIEFYNNANAVDIFSELINILKPEFIFSKKEKSIHYISDGNIWKKE
jgi:competence protein ComEC